MPIGQTVDVRYVNPFVASAMNAVLTLCKVEMQRGVPYVKDPAQPRDYDVSGGIALTGRLTGVVSINFTRNVICSLATKILGEPVSTINHVVCDLVGEMANIVAGTAKQYMPEEEDFKISLPTVVSGRFQSHSYPPGVPCIVVPFKTAPGEFTIEVAIRVTQKN
ncbi:MAG: chemotaxis protein CheX [Verrucomicrobia bacterium]|nr:chemotaxis protein CheX [Verrucomicrobiota bacterium]